MRLIGANPELEIDLLLTDVVLPLLGGQKLVEKMGTVQPHLKVLFMSGYTDNAIAHHGVLEAGIIPEPDEETILEFRDDGPGFPAAVFCSEVRKVGLHFNNK